MNQVDTGDQGFRTSVNDQLAESDGRGDIPEAESQADPQFDPQERRASSNVELLFKHNAVPPVHSLPAELVLQIIRYVVRPFLQNNKADYYQYIINLSGVCSHWYSIVRDSPRLWNQVHASDSPNIVGMALERSSRHLLDITFDVSAYAERGLEDAQEFIGTIILHRNRWRTVDVSVPSSWIQFVTTALQGPALTLEKLSVTDQDSMYSTHKVELFGGMAPKLQDLTLNGVSIRWNSEIVHGLKFLDLSWIRFPSTKTILSILSHSPQLQKAIISRCGTGETITDSSDSIRLSQLTFLRIDLSRLEAIENILDSVEVSQKCCLAIPFRTGEDVDGILRRRVAGWTSNWNIAAISQFNGLLLDIDGDELRIGIFISDYPEPLTLTVERFMTFGTEFLLAFSSLVETLASWSTKSPLFHLKLGYPPSTSYTARITRLFLKELAQLPPITSLELSGVDAYSLVDIVIDEEASSVFRNVFTLSFLGMNPSDLSSRLEWISRATQFVKNATENSLGQPECGQTLQRVELRVPFNVATEESKIMEVVTKELEGIVGPGKIFVVYADQD
ncbi:hypothetical protein FS837_006752 [Tulasnella sp. UAMH 9824]|nr:hypothetical protein FS837_006752 [Tulasnella sp. UAMH 9824]